MMQETQHPQTTPESTRPELRLTGTQEALIEALRQESEKLLTIYLGALHVLEQTENPDRFALAGHGFRELMDWILKVRTDLSEYSSSLASRVRGLRDEWEKTTKSSTTKSTTGSWEGDVDARLRRFLRSVSRFCEWFDGHHPKRAQEIADALREWDPADAPMPEVLYKVNVGKWDEVRDYFLAVLHHESQTDEDEFAWRQDRCERFLLECLRTPTFEQQAEIDALIGEVEHRDT